MPWAAGFTPDFGVSASGSGEHTADVTRAASVSLRLAREPRAPQRARDAVRRVLVDADASLVADQALLLTTELVSNAVKHGAGRYVAVDAVVREEVVEITVADAGDCGLRFREHPGESGGWGLRIVDALASEWGSSEEEHCVWFRLALTGRAAAGA
jgi:anti-sigma regulatory factor (Ser/Thr protein kinase)